jgi:serine/threonine-protein kinase
MKQCPTCGKQYEDTNTLCPSDGTVLRKDDDSLIGQTLIGKYRIDGRIDEGGMGAVYRATHILMEKVVAIKVLHPALAADDKIVARFTREAKAASRISHPHALTVTDFGESEGGIVFLVMEYLRGRTLKDIVRSEGRMPLERVVEIMRQVSGALEAAHGEGVVHRDLKSDNIMLEETATGGDWAKVLDFGIAKIQETSGKVDPGLTAPNLIIGTPQYMSPEQCAQASHIDSRSDIYSLGVILYELLVGHVPFTGDSPTAIMMKHLQEPVPSVLEERKDLPVQVGRVVERAMAKRPEDRFQTATEFCDALTRAARGEDLEGAATTVATGGAAVTAHSAFDPTTNRIVVPTGENAPARATESSDYDEATVVRAPAETRLEQSEVFVTEPVPDAGFSPWKIAVPAIVVLLAVFGVFYAMRGGDTTNGEATPPLTSDPNGQPVQPVTPPTGAGETNVAPIAGAPTPTPGTTTEGGDAGVPIPDVTTPTAGATPQQNANQNTDDQQADDEEEPNPTPEGEDETPPERERPKRNPTPPPPADTDTDVKPSPAPTPRRRTAPTPPPATADPPDLSGPEQTTQQTPQP